jgi:integrase/recombinase XerD
MLTIYRRHRKSCSFARKPRHAKGARNCRERCPIWVQGTLGGEAVKKSLDLSSWERATELIRDWEENGKIGELSRTADPHVKKQEPTENGAHPDNIKPSLKEGTYSIEAAIREYLQDCSARKLDAETLKKYGNLLEGHLLRFCQEQKLTLLPDLCLSKLRMFRNEWDFAPITHCKNLEYLRTFLRFCVASGWISSNPAEVLKAPEVDHVPTLPFEEEEVSRLLDACDRWRYGTGRWRENGQKLRAYLLVLRYTGLRACDGLLLERGQLQESRVFLYQAKTGTPVYVPVPPVVVEALKGLKKRGNRFFCPDDRAAKIQYVYQVWRRKLIAVAKIAGVKNPHFHRFRDTFAVSLLNEGVSIEIVSVLLGHASIKVTEKHYKPWVRSLQDKLEAAVRLTWDDRPRKSLEFAGSNRMVIASPEVAEAECTRAS